MVIHVAIRPFPLTLTGGKLHTGIGAVVRDADGLDNYCRLIGQHDYDSGVLHVPGGLGVPTLEHVHVMRRADFADVLMALATMEYLDAFILTIQSAPGFKEAAGDVLRTLGREADLTWEKITVIAGRWATLAKGQLA